MVTKSTSDRTAAMRAMSSAVKYGLCLPRTTRLGALDARTGQVRPRHRAGSLGSGHASDLPIASVIPDPDPFPAWWRDLQVRVANVARVADVRIARPRLDDPTQATKAALRSIAQRARTLRDEIKALDHQIHQLLTATAPTTLNVFAMGPDTTAALLVSVGDNPDRPEATPPEPHREVYPRVCPRRIGA